MGFTATCCLYSGLAQIYVIEGKQTHSISKYSRVEPIKESVEKFLRSSLKYIDLLCILIENSVENVKLIFKWPSARVIPLCFVLPAGLFVWRVECERTVVTGLDDATQWV